MKLPKMSPEEIQAKADAAEGRVSTPDTDYEDAYSPEAFVRRSRPYNEIFCQHAEKLCEHGFTDPEIAGFFEVSLRTIVRWKADHPEFGRALKTGKAVSDERVERSLYHRAIGYTFDSEKVFQFKGDIVRTPFREHLPPDTTACIFWLKNRRPDEWREKQDITLRRTLADMPDEEVFQALADLRAQKKPKAETLQ